MALSSTNRMLTLIAVSMTMLFIVIYHSKLTKQFGLFYYEGTFRGFWSVLKLLSRFSLFSLCAISYFWELPTERHITKESSEDNISIHPQQPNNFKTKVHQYTDAALTHFLQLAFTAFWPRRTTSPIVIKCAFVLSVYMVPLLHICTAYCRILGRGEWTFFLVIKFVRKLVQLSLFMYGVHLGKQYFRRPPIYPKDVKFAKMPWRRYRTLDSTAGQSKRKTSQTSKWILFGLVFTCILEAFLMEYEHLNRREGARIIEAERSNYIAIFHKFFTGRFSQTIFPIFVYPVEVFVLFCTLLWSSLGRKLIKGLCTYYILISAHVTVVTILSLVVVWEIERFDCDLRYNLIEVFEKTSDAKSSAKRRLYIFDQIKIKRNELIPHLSVLFHYLMVDRLLFIILDFWNFTCDQRIDFNLSAFMARHLFQLILTAWVVLKMALFNLNWPYQLLDTVHRWRLQSWILSADHDTAIQDMKLRPDTSHTTDCKEAEEKAEGSLLKEALTVSPTDKTNDRSYYYSTRYFLDKEYELWSQYLSQERFVKRFGFRIFGYRVDIRWFTLSFIFQLVFIATATSQKYFGSASEFMCGPQQST